MARGAIVTGASSGIGLAIAMKHLSEGDDVVLVSRSLQRLEAALPLDFKPKGKPHFLAKDVSRVEDCKAIIEEGAKLLGREGRRLDALVNNAGGGRLGLTVANMTPEDWAFHLDLNLNSVLWLTQAAAPLLEATKGSIVNISSIGAQRTMAGLGAYCVAKAAVNMLTQTAALELGPKGVRVNAICPSTVETPIFASAGMSPEQITAFIKAQAAEHPIGRIGQPLDVAELCYFLTDNSKSGWLTGQLLSLDGGRLLSMPNAPGASG